MYCTGIFTGLRSLTQFFFLLNIYIYIHIFWKATYIRIHLLYFIYKISKYTPDTHKVKFYIYIHENDTQSKKSSKGRIYTHERYADNKYNNNIYKYIKSIHGLANKQFLKQFPVLVWLPTWSYLKICSFSNIDVLKSSWSSIR